jgi:hypothetical protein
MDRVLAKTENQVIFIPGFDVAGRLCRVRVWGGWGLPLDSRNRTLWRHPESIRSGGISAKLAADTKSIEKEDIL